ncbi:hypothetical protein HDV05_008509 [Chytridiales sp. JEL 0842]|nr:hypothetical protein HDV05_008509 [Chytridiales sp. JEL 0842]
MHYSKMQYYAVLGLEKDCTEVELKKAYRKLALLYHPDKCTAPGADDAFKAVGHSFSILSDADKRSHYDQYGTDPDSIDGKKATMGPLYADTGLGSELTPDDLFRMFFADVQVYDGTVTATKAERLVPKSIDKQNEITKFVPKRRGTKGYSEGEITDTIALNTADTIRAPPGFLRYEPLLRSVRDTPFVMDTHEILLSQTIHPAS